MRDSRLREVSRKAYQESRRDELKANFILLHESFDRDIYNSNMTNVRLHFLSYPWPSVTWIFSGSVACMMNAIPVELDVISIRRDHDYAEHSTGNTADNKEDLDKTAVCRNSEFQKLCCLRIVHKNLTNRNKRRNHDMQSSYRRA